MQIYCRQCNAQVVAEDIDLPQRLAKCRKCHAVFSIAGILAAEGVAGDDRPRAKPAPPQPPAHVVVEEWGSDLTVWYRWFEWSVLGLVFFCVLWDGFLVVWYSIALFAPLNGGDPRWIMLVFPILHVAVGVALTYAVLCTLFNSTWIQLSMGVLTIRHGPLPTGGNQMLDAHQIDQLFVAQGTGWRNNNSSSYSLIALLQDGTRVEVLTATQPELLLWLEQKLEEKLKIKDRHVQGEVEW
jgi:hypothetical protein